MAAAASSSPAFSSTSDLLRAHILPRVDSCRGSSLSHDSEVFGVDPADLLPRRQPAASSAGPRRTEALRAGPRRTEASSSTLPRITELIKDHLLPRLASGQRPLDSFIHDADVYDDVPAELTTKFFSPLHCTARIEREGKIVAARRRPAEVELAIEEEIMSSGEPRVVEDVCRPREVEGIEVNPNAKRLKLASSLDFDFHAQPTDAELITGYLGPRASSGPPLHNVHFIHEVPDIYRTHPQIMCSSFASAFSADGNDIWYFFNTLRKMGKRGRRKDSSMSSRQQHWKSDTGLTKICKDTVTIGHCQLFTFMEKAEAKREPVGEWSSSPYIRGKEGARGPQPMRLFFLKFIAEARKELMGEK
ncbi:hypothetical protein ACQ4PT_028046 [Festuca glaucescens]